MIGYQLTPDATAIGSASLLPSIGRSLPAKQFGRFLVFSGIAAGSNLLAGYLFYVILGLNTGWNYSLSVALAFLVGMSVSFALNRRYTFSASGRRLYDEIRTFFVVSVGGLFLTVFLADVFLTTLLPAMLSALSLADSWPFAVNYELVSHMAAIGLVAFYSFTAHSLFSFGKGIRHYLRNWSRVI